MTVNIRTLRKKSGDPIFPETQNKVKGTLGLYGVALMEKETVEKRTKIGLVLKDKEGQYFTSYISADTFRTIVGALNGAEEFWNKNPE